MLCFIIVFSISFMWILAEVQKVCIVASRTFTPESEESLEAKMGPTVKWVGEKTINDSGEYLGKEDTQSRKQTVSHSFLILRWEWGTSACQLNTLSFTWGTTFNGQSIKLTEGWHVLFAVMCDCTAFLSGAHVQYKGGALWAPSH